MIAVLGGPADVEQDLIRTRAADGRSRAQARGQIWGDRRSSRCGSRRKHGGRDERATLKELAASYNVGIATFRG